MSTDLNIRKCPACGIFVEIDDNYCGNCGASIPSMPEQSTSQAKRCPKCREVSITDNLYCTDCGNKLEGIDENAPNNDLTIILNIKSESTTSTIEPDATSPIITEPFTEKNEPLGSRLSQEISIDDAINSIRSSDLSSPAAAPDNSSLSGAKTFKIVAACVVGGLIFLGSLFVALNWARHLGDDVASKPVPQKTKAISYSKAEKKSTKGSPAVAANSNSVMNKTYSQTLPVVSPQIVKPSVQPTKPTASAKKPGGTIATVQQIGYMKMEVSNAQASFISSAMNPIALAKAEARYRAAVGKLGHALYTNYNYSGRGTAAAKQDMRSFMSGIWSGIPSPAVAQEVNRGVAAVK